MYEVAPWKQEKIKILSAHIYVAWGFTKIDFIVI